MPRNRNRRRPYGFPIGSGLPPLTGPSNVPPISAGGTVDIDEGYDFRERGYAGEMDLYGASQRDAYNTRQQAYLDRINTNNNIRANASGLWTGAERERAIGGYNDSDAFFGRQMADGGFDAATSAGLESSLADSLNDKGMQLASSINSTLAQRGLGANPYAAAQAKQKAAFETAGAVGRLKSDIRMQQIDNQFRGAAGHSSNAGQKANILGQATREGALTQIQDEGAAPGAWDSAGARPIYDYYRNSSGRSDATDDNWGIGGSGGGGFTGGGMTTRRAAKRYADNYSQGSY